VSLVEIHLTAVYKVWDSREVGLSVHFLTHASSSICICLVRRIYLHDARRLAHVRCVSVRTRPRGAFLKSSLSPERGSRSQGSFVGKSKECISHMLSWSQAGPVLEFHFSVRMCYSTPLREEIRPEILGCQDLSGFPVDLLSDGDSVLNGQSESNRRRTAEPH